MGFFFSDVLEPFFGGVEKGKDFRRYVEYFNVRSS